MKSRVEDITHSGSSTLPTVGYYDFKFLIPLMVMGYERLDGGDHATLLVPELPVWRDPDGNWQWHWSMPDEQRVIDWLAGQGVEVVEAS